MSNKDSSPPLPDTTQWLPRINSSETLKSAFLKRCTGIETLIRIRAQFEKEMNIDNFDSGPGVEDIIRGEFNLLLPSRYSVRAGVINDRNGHTGGDFDVIIFNDLWFPVVKAGATLESRRIHLPIDGIYAVCEVKQSLDYAALDKAMEKLVVCHRLHRPRTKANRLVENREINSCSHGHSNPLYSAVIATDLKDGVELDRLVERFFDINKTLKRLEVIRALCVLGHGTVTWGFVDDSGESKPTLFMMEDIYRPIFPVYHKMPRVESALYPLMADLLLHLYHSVLAAEDIAPSYGPVIHNISIPTSQDIALMPDAEHLTSLSKFCETPHRFAQPANHINSIRKNRKKPRRK